MFFDIFVFLFTKLYADSDAMGQPDTHRLCEWFSGASDSDKRTEQVPIIDSTEAGLQGRTSINLSVVSHMEVARCIKVIQLSR